MTAGPMSGDIRKNAGGAHSPPPPNEHERTLLQKLIDCIPDALFVKDCEGRFVISNKAHGAALGVESPESVLGRTETDFLPAEAARRIRAEDRFVMETKKPTLDHEEPVKDAEGNEIWLSTTKYPLLDDHEMVIGIAVISRDITSTRRVQDHESKLEEQLVQSQKLDTIGRLAGGVAHDFNNMLGAISGYAQVLNNRYSSLDPGIGKYAQRMIKATCRCADLTGKLLAFARKGNYEKEPVDLHGMVNEVCRLLEHTIDKRITIKTRLHARHATINGDRGQLQNAILNLALNARDAMPQGGRLTLATRNVRADKITGWHQGADSSKKSCIELKVSDTGTGIPEEVKKHIFEPFFSTKGPGKGTGLGLASVYGTVKNHEGHIDVENMPGKGATFRIFLPVCTGTPHRDEPANRISDRGSGRIMLVDDEELFRDFAMETLSDLGYTVTTCANGREAVDFFRNHAADIDLAIIDMIMPEMGGYDCIKLLRQINPDLKVIITTGYAVAQDTQRIITSGVVGFIQKPFQIRELSELISRGLGKSS